MPPKDEKTETITITATWKTTHHVEVPKGWRPASRLEDFPPGVLDEITSEVAELVDWE